jgi:hypothetical protein
MEHDRPTYRVPMMPPISFRRTFEPPDKIDTLKWGTYHHVAANWIWRDEDAHR